MITCPSCGAENPTGFRFCGSCGAVLAEAQPAREVRKTVTVLFCDVVGSTALGERVDPEPLRRLMASYYDEMRTIVERHGGTVEKFIGDAVMAVFGVPQAHEDDALRAVRAAAEMHAAATPLELQIRIGINTGEVVTGEGETLVTGDAVNVAARLEQAAAAGETLIGGETLRLVRDAVETESTEAFELKGKAEPIEAHRVLAVDPDAPSFARRLDRPMVGRQRELERLLGDFEQSVKDRSCHMFTLLGQAGVGKSRLVRAFVAAVGDRARVLRGRCLHYGDGITYWPVVEVLLELGHDPQPVIAGSPAEAQLAFRKLLEEEAALQPVVVYFDDLQWAEPTFLDLVEHIADWSRDAPIFLLCAARPDLLDLRPAWGGGKLNASSLLLESLSPDESGVLVEQLLEQVELDKIVRARIVEAAEGNPLFVEEMVAMVRDDGGDDEIIVPPTIHALLQARLDRLGGDERTVIERGAVEGKVFHRGAVLELAPEPVRPAVGTHLLGLVRKELIRPEQPTLPGDDAFRFRHLLIRDAAYESVPKEMRAKLHEQFAIWLDAHADLIEQDEIVGYHLEQAARYSEEIGSPRPEVARAQAYARMFVADLDLVSVRSSSHSFAVLVDETASAVTIFERHGDQKGVAYASRLAAYERWGALRFAEAIDRFETAAAHAARAGMSYLEDDARKAIAMAHVFGPTPISQAIERLEQLMAENTGRPLLLVTLQEALARALATRGDIEAARGLQDVEDFYLEAGMEVEATSAYNTRATVAHYAGDFDEEVRILEAMAARLEELHALAFLSTTYMDLGRCLADLGRDDDAQRARERARELTSPDDVIDVVGLAALDAVLRGRRGELAEAQELAQQALARVEEADMVDLRLKTRWSAAEVFQRAGRIDEAKTLLEESVQLADRYEHVVAAQRARERLAALG
jgi:class 3 adenylate cyclase/tetratricopeptide (TPR) repeat protein